MTNQDGTRPDNVAGTNPHRGPSVKNRREHYPKAVVFSSFGNRPGRAGLDGARTSGRCFRSDTDMAIYVWEVSIKLPKHRSNALLK